MNETQVEECTCECVDTLDLLDPDETICLLVRELRKIRNAPPCRSAQHSEPEPEPEPTPPPSGTDWSRSWQLDGKHTVMFNLPKLRAVDSFHLLIAFDPGSFNSDGKDRFIEAEDRFIEAGRERHEYSLYYNEISNSPPVQVPLLVALVEEGQQWKLVITMRNGGAWGDEPHRTVLSLGSRLRSFELDVKESAKQPGSLRCKILERGIIGHIPIYPDGFYHGPLRLGKDPEDKTSGLWPEARWSALVSGELL